MAMILKAQATKQKQTNDTYKTKKFLHGKENNQKVEKAIYELEKNYCQSIYLIKRLKFKI